MTHHDLLDLGFAVFFAVFTVFALGDAALNWSGYVKRVPRLCSSLWALLLFSLAGSIWTARGLIAFAHPNSSTPGWLGIVASVPMLLGLLLEARWNRRRPRRYDG